MARLELFRKGTQRVIKAAAVYEAIKQMGERVENAPMSSDELAHALVELANLYRTVDENTKRATGAITKLERKFDALHDRVERHLVEMDNSAVAAPTRAVAIKPVDHRPRSFMSDP